MLVPKEATLKFQHKSAKSDKTTTTTTVKTTTTTPHQHHNRFSTVTKTIKVNSAQLSPRLDVKVSFSLLQHNFELCNNLFQPN